MSADVTIGDANQRRNELQRSDYGTFTVLLWGSCDSQSLEEHSPRYCASIAYLCYNYSFEIELSVPRLFCSYLDLNAHSVFHFLRMF